MPHQLDDVHHLLDPHVGVELLADVPLALDVGHEVLVVRNHHCDLAIMALEGLLGDLFAAEVAEEVSQLLFVLVATRDLGAGGLSAAGWVEPHPGLIDYILRSRAESLGQRVYEFLIADVAVAVLVKMPVQVLQIDHLGEDSG